MQLHLAKRHQKRLFGLVIISTFDISLRFLSFLSKEKKATHRWVIVDESVIGIYEGGRSKNRGRCRIVR